MVQGPTGSGVRFGMRRPKRPKFWEVLRMLRDGRADGLLCVDADRGVGTHLRDLEDLIDVVELYGVQIWSMTAGEPEPQHAERTPTTCTLRRPPPPHHARGNPSTPRPRLGEEGTFTEHAGALRA